MVPRKAKRFTARVGETGRRMKERIQFKNSYTSFLRMTQSGWGDGVADKKSAGPSPEWWRIRPVRFLVKGFFFCWSPAKMRLFENLGIWVDFFNGATKMLP